MFWGVYWVYQGPPKALFLPSTDTYLCILLASSSFDFLRRVEMAAPCFGVWLISRNCSMILRCCSLPSVYSGDRILLPWNWDMTALLFLLLKLLKAAIYPAFSGIKLGRASFKVNVSYWCCVWFNISFIWSSLSWALKFISMACLSKCSPHISQFSISPKISVN